MYIRMIARAALAEDIGGGDITTEAVVLKGQKAKALIIAKEPMVVAGIDVAREVFKTVDKRMSFRPMVKDGERVKKGAGLVSISGNLRAILAAERTALNFLQRLSGIATLTADFVGRVKPFNTRILDTRKTTPCLRPLERLAVRAGKGFNHRFGLSQAILIKDNHIKAAGSVACALRRAKKRHPDSPIEVEVNTLKELEEALNHGAGLIMLDNMGVKDMRKAVAIIGGRAFVEASGRVTVDNIKEIAATGVDAISIGRLTHSARAMDISLEVISD
ncbi:MAG: carboxylating nicotinate-nucleotide diphosphorylase [Deltaproteobacteria bacterium]|nr:carboxylating nicotinate-nucleotide diphosphorylase [Deltaproteobacteria bacterium]